MTKGMFAQLCATVALGAIALLVGRGMHSVGGVVLFGVCVLATILSALRVRSIRMKALATRRRVPQNAATGGGGDRSGST